MNLKPGTVLKWGGVVFAYAIATYGDASSRQSGEKAIARAALAKVEGQ